MNIIVAISNAVSYTQLNLLKKKNKIEFNISIIRKYIMELWAQIAFVTFEIFDILK